MFKPRNKHGPPAGMARTFVVLCQSVFKRLMRNKIALYKVEFARFSGIPPIEGSAVPDFVVSITRLWFGSG
jgi:hypothetical protein